MKFRICIIFVVLLIAKTGVCQNTKIISNELYAPTTSEKAEKFYNTGHDAIESRDFKKAVQYFKLAIAEDPGYVDAYDNLGLSFRQLNMLDSAEHYYLISIKMYQKEIVARGNMAVVEEKRGNLDKAAAY